jgi:hypothetical protein
VAGAGQLFTPLAAEGDTLLQCERQSHNGRLRVVQLVL